MSALRFVVCAAALPWIGAAFAEQADPVLGDAPVRHESQDTSAWLPRPKAGAAGTREQVVHLYNSVFVPGGSVPLIWSGSVSACHSGTTNVDHRQAVIDRVNYYRALVDLPAVALSGGAATTQSQAAALMISANNALSHSPPSSWRCYTPEGSSGAGSSNLCLGCVGTTAIDAYMDDPGNSNSAVGHRRWILFPPRTAMATGDVDGDVTPPRPANALHVLGTLGERPATPNGIAWPPAGFVPYQNLPARSNRWSISFPGADFGNAAVTMAGPEGEIPVGLERVANGYGDNTLVFLPQGISYARPAVDSTYTVAVRGITGSGAPGSIQYDVTVIDPSAPAPPPAATLSAVEYFHAGFGHYFLTALPEEITALDAGAFTGWTRTTQAMKVYSAGTAGTSNVCRFFSAAFAPKSSHFYTPLVEECEVVKQNLYWQFEGQVFALKIPFGTGACPGGTAPLYRLYNDGRSGAPNHRYTTSLAIRSAMVDEGWVPEGYGPAGVIGCVPD